MLTEERTWSHRLPSACAVERFEFLQGLVRSRSVIDVGFRGRDTGKVGEGWLHEVLASSAARVVGIDLDEAGVHQAAASGYEAHMADCQDPESVRRLGLRGDVVVAGEIIEHLDRPGAFLDAMHHLSDNLVITTPNALSLFNIVGVAFRREIVNPDHVAVYSCYTLAHALERHGWKIHDLLVYNYARSIVRNYESRRLVRWIFDLQGAVSRVRPFFAQGLIAVCESG